MKTTIGAVILAAGEGKRLKLDVPKPLAPCLDKKLIDFPLREIAKFFTRNNLQGTSTVVIGHQRDLVKNYVEKNHKGVGFAVQEKQLGTADALRAYFSSSQETLRMEYTLVICADTPLVSERELFEMLTLLREKNCEAVAATFEELTPRGYGRIIRETKGFSIVEEKDATESEKKITEVNSGLYLFKTSYLTEHLGNVNANNSSKEFYLTDVFKKNLNVMALRFPCGQIFLGVNDLEQLEKAEQILRAKKNASLRENGVRFIDSSHTYIDDEVEIGAGTVIFPNTFILGKSKIGKNVMVEAGTLIRDSVVADNAKILAYSILENTILHTGAQVGPYSRLRPGAEIGVDAKIGNFVEIKKSILERGAKVSHLSYIGDAFIGEETNIGCGFITCNYDGAEKHVTKIGKNCFIGSDSQTVAPVTIGDDCFVASATTVTKNMPDGSFAISRGTQVTKEKMAKKFIKTKKNKDKK